MKTLVEQYLSEKTDYVNGDDGYHKPKIHSVECFRCGDTFNVNYYGYEDCECPSCGAFYELDQLIPE